MKRRAFFLGAGAALAMPAIVRAESLMKIVMPTPSFLMPYKGKQLMDAALYYSPYEPILISLVKRSNPNLMSFGDICSAQRMFDFKLPSDL